MKIIYLVVCLFIYTTSLSQGVLLDEFESLSDWEKVESEA
jgi:hypothetical protein